MIPQSNKILFYKTGVHACSYLPQQQAATLFAEPHTRMTPHIYSRLVDNGFRRSGSHVYRPHCADCNACVLVRIPVTLFQPRRNQKRIWNRNQDIQVIAAPAEFDPQHFALYRRYIADRHAGGGMDTDDAAQYQHFLISPWCNTVFYQFFLAEQLVAVAVVDVLQQGLSAVYTFYDPSPALAARSLGSFAILWQIQETQHRQLPWLYLGYWVENCQKMAYKRHYHPLEGYFLGQNAWHWIEKGCDLEL